VLRTGDLLQSLGPVLGLGLHHVVSRIVHDEDLPAMSAVHEVAPIAVVRAQLPPAGQADGAHAPAQDPDHHTLVHHLVQDARTLPIVNVPAEEAAQGVEARNPLESVRGCPVPKAAVSVQGIVACHRDLDLAPEVLEDECNYNNLSWRIREQPHHQLNCSMHEEKRVRGIMCLVAIP